jgi:coniferyl-aldehyde dehydrogenase
MRTTRERVDDAVGGRVDHLRAILERQRAAFMAEGPPSVTVRRNRIDRLLALVLDNADDFIDAMETDFGTRPKTGKLFTEVLGMISVIEHTRSHVPQWMRATKLMRGARLARLKAEVQPSPLGVVGIIGPWNYPLQLVVLPASAAFAAGNRVMVKMSEITPSTAELMKSTASKYFDPNELEIVTGGPEVSVAFSRLPFDHLFFTGSPAVGSLVQQAAAQNLVPVTLELGGKNPVVVSPDADIKRSATRIAAARMINGDRCVSAPTTSSCPMTVSTTSLTSRAKHCGACSRRSSPTTTTVHRSTRPISTASSGSSKTPGPTVRRSKPSLPPGNRCPTAPLERSRPRSCVTSTRT